MRDPDPARARSGVFFTELGFSGSGVMFDPSCTEYVRTVDQVRADILADLLLTAAPEADPTRRDDGPGTLGAIRARVQVVVPALTMRLFDGKARADAFVAARIENVMSFEKWKAGKDFEAPLKRLTDTLSRLRYGRS
jgi:hypothetical protein